MRILVTGGAGFIASHVVDGYLQDGHEVAVVDNLSTGFRENVHPRARFYEADLRDAETLAAIFARERPEVVNHHAAQMDVRRSTRDPVYDATCNILGSLNLILACVRHSVRKILYISTGGAVYGEPLAIPVTEEHRIQPISPYGVSKHTVEHYLHLYATQHGFSYTVLRYPNVFGPRQNPLGESGVVAIFTGQLLSIGFPRRSRCCSEEGVPRSIGFPRRSRCCSVGSGVPPLAAGFAASGGVPPEEGVPLVASTDGYRPKVSAVVRPRIFGDGGKTRDYVFIDDIVRANRLALDRGENAIYNLGSGIETSDRQVFDTVRAAVDVDVEPLYEPPRAGEIRRIALDASRARSDLGWNPTVCFAEGVRRTVAFHRDQLERRLQSGDCSQSRLVCKGEPRP